jgi:membrane fusion protein, multidrug efflux system
MAVIGQGGPAGWQAAGALLLVLVPGGCGPGDEATGAVEAPPAVVVAPVVMREVADTREFVGRTEAVDEVDVRARVTGFLIERPFEDGQLVEPGDRLFVIDAAEFRAARQATQAEVQRAEAALRLARTDLDRAQTLARSGSAAISQAEIDRRIAEAAQAEATISATKAALEQADLRLGYTEIRSPIAGRVGVSAYAVGNLIGPDSGVLASVVTLDPIYVWFPVSERDLLDVMHRRHTLEGIETELTPRLRLSDGSLYPLEGRLDFLDNRIDPTTGTIRARAVFPNPDRMLVPGQYVTTLLTQAEETSRALIPQTAVQQNQAGSFVLVVGDDDRVAARQITTGPRVGAEWVVEDGLQAGELVVVEGLQKVRPGAAVQAVPAGTAAAGR